MQSWNQEKFVVVKVRNFDFSARYLKPSKTGRFCGAYKDIFTALLNTGHWSQIQFKYSVAQSKGRAIFHNDAANSKESQQPLIRLLL